jgi:hypothetical protein
MNAERERPIDRLTTELDFLEAILSQIFAEFNQQLSQGNVLFAIDSQHLYCRSTDIGDPQQFGAEPGEVIFPTVLARMKKPRQLLRLRVDSGNVWAFVGVAVVTCQGKILGRVVATVLFCDDMFDLERQLVECLRQPTVLAA